MYYISIDKESKTAYYIQLMNSIITAIDAGILRDRDKLPTEDEIIECLNVSRFVVRQAYENLLKAGYIISTRGKGSYIAQRKPIRITFDRLFNLDSVLREHGVEVRAQLVLREVLKEPSQMKTVLDLEAGDSCFHVIQVLCDINRNPYIIQEYCFPYALYTGIENRYMPGSHILDLLEHDYKLKPVEVKSVFSAINANNKVALLLNLDYKAPVVEIRSVLVDEHGKSLFAQRAYFDATRFEADSEVLDA